MGRLIESGSADRRRCSVDTLLHFSLVTPSSGIPPRSR
jgi:hypothetical protein